MINVLTLRPGDRLELEDGTIAEVLENMEDGMWVQVRYLQVPRSAPLSSATRRILQSF